MNYTLSGLYKKDLTLCNTIDFIEKHPESTRPNTHIESVFGSFPNCIWNGGRSNIGYAIPLRVMKDIIYFHNSRGIGVNFTYSNPHLRTKHLGDYLCNTTLELIHNPLNGVIVNNLFLENHIKEHFPELKLIGSCTAANYESAFLRKRIQEVDILVVPPELNRDRYMLKILGISKVELLVNENCELYCPRKRRHYEHTAAKVLEFDDEAIPGRFEDCKLHNDDGSDSDYFHAHRNEFLRDLTLKEIYDLNKIGVRRFKFQGRMSDTFTYQKVLCYYLINEEYHNPYLRAVQKGELPDG